MADCGCAAASRSKLSPVTEVMPVAWRAAAGMSEQTFIEHRQQLLVFAEVKKTRRLGVLPRQRLAWTPLYRLWDPDARVTTTLLHSM